MFSKIFCTTAVMSEYLQKFVRNPFKAIHYHYFSFKISVEVSRSKSLPMINSFDLN
jgi:hypothetical protein